MKLFIDVFSIPGICLEPYMDMPVHVCWPGIKFNSENNKMHCMPNNDDENLSLDYNSKKMYHTEFFLH